MTLCPVDTPFSKQGTSPFLDRVENFSGISTEDECEPCVDNSGRTYDCKPGQARKLCPAGQYIKEVDFTEEPYPLLIKLDNARNFEKNITPSDGWATYECVDCDPGHYCVGFGKIASD